MKKLSSFRQLYVDFITIKTTGSQPKTNVLTVQSLRDQHMPKGRWENFWSSSHGNFSTYEMSPRQRCTNYCSTKSTSCYASLLVQRRLEIPCSVEVYMPRKVKNKEIISKYREMIETLYQEEDCEVGL